MFLFYEFYWMCSLFSPYYHTSVPWPNKTVSCKSFKSWLDEELEFYNSLSPLMQEVMLSSRLGQLVLSTPFITEAPSHFPHTHWLGKSTDRCANVPSLARNDLKSHGGQCQSCHVVNTVHGAYVWCLLLDPHTWYPESGTCVDDRLK